MKKLALGLFLVLSPALISNHAFAHRDEPVAQASSNEHLWILGAATAAAAWGVVGYIAYKKGLFAQPVAPAHPVARAVGNIVGLGACAFSFYSLANAVYLYNTPIKFN